ncbi:MAG: alpha/beta hydrolase, partial [Bradyrhizobium sp.]|nr:alpha/beta hydrolase [Bradyrhizobium sp.]
MNRILPAALAAILLTAPASSANAADTVPREPYGIALEGFAYPYPVHQL